MENQDSIKRRNVVNFLLVILQIQMGNNELKTACKLALTKA
jgi:hypothetical protein